MQLIIFVAIGVLVPTCLSGPLINGQCTDEDYLVPLPVCPENENPPSYFSHPADCTKYFMCSNGEPICFECDKTLRWDQKIQSCNHDFLVECHVGSTAAPPPVDVLCPPNYPGLVPHHNCSMYYQCTHGQPVEMFCGDLFFDRYRNRCNWPECVEECLGGTRPPIGTTKAPDFEGSTGRECGV